MTRHFPSSEVVKWPFLEAASSDLKLGNPSASVIVPAVQVATFMREAQESVFAQSFKGFDGDSVHRKESIEGDRNMEMSSEVSVVIPTYNGSAVCN